jgi:hypothetical protein
VDQRTDSAECAEPDPVLDAVVVPAWRSVADLAPAIRLAQDLGTRLVLLCSGRVRADEACTAATGLTVAAIDIPPGFRNPLLDFATSKHPAVADAQFTDVRVKRNLGLLLARMSGWSRILFLDDDHLLGPAQARAAGAALRTHRVAAFRAEEFPDRSVVRHAEQLAGGTPAISPSIGTAAVRLDAGTTFFPEVYNEDWLFLYDSAAPGPADAGTVRQLPYDPFARPARAAAEEFGDVLAEGLVRFREAGLHATEASEADWTAVVRERGELLGDLARRLRARDDAKPALRALEAAADRLSRTTGEQLVSYVTLWREDVERWRERLDAVGGSLPAASALRFLGLHEQAVLSAAEPAAVATG